MGQYQQWIHSQEIDRKLRKTRKALEEELAELESQLDSVFLEQITQQSFSLSHSQRMAEGLTEAPLSTNPIVAALLANLNPSYGYDAVLPEEAYSRDDLQDQPAAPNSQASQEPWWLVNRPDMDLLPEDMHAFIDEHTMTNPQIELPWWLKNITNSTRYAGDGRTGEQGNIQTNRLVQRWIERWGRPSSPVPEQEIVVEDDASA